MTEEQEIADVLRRTEVQQRALRSNQNAMLRLLRGSLRGLDTYDLALLKHELSQFNAHRKIWKN